MATERTGLTSPFAGAWAAGAPENFYDEATVFALPLSILDGYLILLGRPDAAAARGLGGGCGPEKPPLPGSAAARRRQSAGRAGDLDLQFQVTPHAAARGLESRWLA